ncbi:MAG: M15 family peptidase [Candidatus Binatia bacterium]
MPKFGKSSKANLSTCHPDLQRLFGEVIKVFDCSVIKGHRGEADQNRAYMEKASKLKWPESKHNSNPSMAADVVPYPICWAEDKKKTNNPQRRFYFFAGYVKAVAEIMGIQIRIGADWDMDTDLGDQTFNDLPHFELIETRPPEVYDK